MLLILLLLSLDLCSSVSATTCSAPSQIQIQLTGVGSEAVIRYAVVGGKSTDSNVCSVSVSSSLASAAVSTGTTSTYTISSYTSPLLVQCKLTGLTQGGVRYYYKVGSEDCGYSELYSFKSAPAHDAAVTFHVVGDLGQTVNSNNTLLELADNDAALSTSSGGIMSMGDLSYANGDEPLWDSFGDLLSQATRSIPIYTTVGNHEWFDDSSSSFTAFKSRFYSPSGELYYSFDSGYAHIVMISGYCSEMKSTRTQPCLASGSSQYDWLVADLKSVDRKTTPFVIAVFHQPFVNSNTAHDMASEGKPMQEAVEGVLFQGGVDLVLSGHVHAYERSCALYQYACNSAGPTYVTIGDGGNAEGLATTWVDPQPKWSVFRQASYGHGELTVHNTTHLHWEWHQNGDLSPVVADSFWIIKLAPVDLHAAHETPARPVTKEPVFADSDRGRRARDFNDARVRARKI